MDGFAEELAAMRQALLRRAHAHLRNPEWAADAVSATTLAVMEARPRLADTARLRAWVFGVLRHKVVDQLRRELGACRHDSPVAVGDARDPAAHPPAHQPQPDDPMRRACAAQFVAALVQALAQLPERQARAFVMCEAWGMDTAEVCQALGVNSGHLWVLRHRARRRLQAALAAHADD